MSLSIDDTHMFNVMNRNDKANLKGAVEQCSSSRGHAMFVESIEKEIGVWNARCSYVGYDPKLKYHPISRK